MATTKVEAALVVTSKDDFDEDSEDDKQKAKADSTIQSSSDDSSEESDEEAMTGGTKTLFVGNLPSNVGRCNIEKFFETAGRVVDVRLVTSNKDGSFMGYGYAEFASSEEAQKALVELQGQTLLNRKMRLDMSIDRGCGVVGATRREIGSGFSIDRLCSDDSSKEESDEEEKESPKKKEPAPATSKAVSADEDSDEDSEDDKPPQKKAKAETKIATRQSSSSDISIKEPDEEL